MKDIQDKIKSVDWEAVSQSLHSRGYALIPGLLTAMQCWELRDRYRATTGYRKTIVMERYRFGQGEYKYFRYPLPDLIQNIRTHLYPYLVPIADSWMRLLHINQTFPPTHEGLLQFCREKNQLQPTALVLKYQKGGYNALHQDLYGEVYFPMQAVFFLSERIRDYMGGEFVLVQQNPRAQSKAIVLTPGEGDMLIFATNFYPVQSSKGYHRVNMRHGVSEVHQGTRYTLGIIFHDALT